MTEVGKALREEEEEVVVVKEAAQEFPLSESYGGSRRNSWGPRR
jgi:hypothetical protein